MEMETTTCVIDANTLIDHIHEVKALVYDGHIQLCVPLSTIDYVDEIWKKSLEPKPEPEKAARPKSGGKPARVFPTFDISPRIAKEFLERSKQDGKKLAVEFQKEEEQFTVWKNLEIREEQERQKNADGKPATFAAALLAKLNTAEAPAESSKAPVKPKLVAKGSGASNSPWKKAVPSIAAEGVPLSLRPFIGYLLWRLHERETYSFTKDSSILISNDQETIDVGKKLGVTTKTFPALRAQILARNKPGPDIATSGAVEREFGVRPKRVPASRNGDSQQVENALDETDGQAYKPESPSQENSAANVAEPAEDLGSPKEADKIEIQEEHAKENVVGPVKDVETSKEPDKIDTQVNQVGDDGLEPLQPQAAPAEHSVNSKPEELDLKEKIPVTPRAWADVVSNRTRPPQPKSPLPVPTALAQNTAAETISDKSTNFLDDPVAQEKTSTILDWVQKVKATTIKETEAQISLPTYKKHRSRKSKEPTPPPEEPSKPFRPVLMQRPPNASQVPSENRSSRVASENAHSQITSDKPLSPIHTPPIENGTRLGSTKHTPNISVSSAQSESIKGPKSEHLSTEAPRAEAPVADEPEDSEEEVVVFNPRAKRLSAQKQQASKQISPERHPQNHEPAPLPVEASPMPQAQSSKPTSPERTNQTKPRKQPKPRAPVVIDPDAFGRDFASNPRSNHQHQRPHSHARGGFQQGPPRRPLSQHGPPPDRHVPQQGPPLQRPNSQHGPPRSQLRGGRGHHHSQARLNVQADTNGPNGYAPNVQAEPSNADGNLPNVQSGSNRMNGNVSKPKAGQNGQNGHLMGTENGQSRPNNRTARNSPPREPIVETTGPDVDFVLKTGSTRASTRGRGRLWVP